MLLALSFPVEAQQPKRVPRIGLLMSTSIDTMAPFIDAFRQGLRELGYTEGKNIVLKSAGARRNSIEFPILRLS